MKNESNLLTELNEAQKDILSEFDMQYAINDLAFLLEGAESLEHKLVYTAEAVPVFIMNKPDKTTYLIEQENLNKLMTSQHIDVPTALRHITESLEDELVTTINTSDLAVVFAKEDMDQLQSIFKEDVNKIDARCELVSEYTSFLNKIISEGARVIFKERR